MKPLAILLLAFGALPLRATVAPIASSVNTAPGAIGYSTVLLNFNTGASWDRWRLRVSSSSCAAGTGGAIQPDMSGGTRFNTGYGIIAGGLNPGTHYFLCVELSDDGGSTFSPSGAAGMVQATTLSTIENEPRTIQRFNSDYPTTGSFASMPTCPSLNAQNYCKTAIPPGTTDLRSYLDAALTDECSHGTILAMAHSATPIAFTQNTYSSIYASCNTLFWGASSVTGNVIDFGSDHGLSEGDLLTVGQHADYGYPGSNSCYYGTGFYNGRVFYAHVVNSHAISLICGDGSNHPVVIGGAGLAPDNTLFFQPHVQVSGTCPTVHGKEPCTYWKSRGMYEVIIRSDADDSLLPPPGARLTPAYCASGLCSIWINPVSNVNNSSSSAAFFVFGNNDGNVNPLISNVRLGPGIEITNEVDPGQGTYANMVITGGSGSGNTLDRVYLHGGETRPPTLQRWGGPSLPAAEFEGYNTAIQDSTIDNLRQWHADNLSDGSSILISEGPGPVRVSNTLIEGAGIPFHSDGGQGGKMYGNESFLRNTFHCPTFMMNGSADSDGHFSGHRQPLEFKAGLGIEVAGNIFDTNWNENNPNGEFIVATPVSGVNQFIGVTDLNIFSNIFKHGPGGIGAPIVVYGGDVITIPPARFAFRNNLFYDIDGRWTAAGAGQGTPHGWWYQGPGGGNEGFTTDHNTWVGNTNAQPASWLPIIARFQTTPMSGWSFTNNFTYHFTSLGWGINQEGGTGVSPCFNLSGQAFADACFTPSYSWRGNVMMSPSATASQIAAQWPTIITQNYNPTNMSLAVTPGWNRYDSTGAGGSYGLKPTSDYRSSATKTLTTGPASDGTDVGIDEPELLRDTGHVFLNDQPVQPIGTTTATVNYVAPDNQGCVVRVAATPWSSGSVPTTGVQEFSDGGSAPGPRSVAMTALPASSTVNGVVFCGTEQPTFTFATH